MWTKGKELKGQSTVDPEWVLAVDTEAAAAVSEVTSQQPAAAQCPLYSHVIPLPRWDASLTFLHRARVHCVRASGHGSVKGLRDSFIAVELG